METIFWIIIFGVLMSLIALVGSLLLYLKPKQLQKVMLPLISFSAGSLIGGAMFHMIPKSVQKMGNETEVYVWLAAGFSLFLGIEQFLNWHHSHTHSHMCNPLGPPHEHNICKGHDASNGCNAVSLEQVQREYVVAKQVVPDVDNKMTTSNKTVPTVSEGQEDIEAMAQEKCPDDTATTEQHEKDTAAPNKEKKPLGYLILVGDAIHNFLGGMFVGASFVDSIELGITSWTAAAMHEVPQEIGDYAVLLHCGWSKRGALFMNFVSATSFLLGGIVAYLTSKSFDVTFLIPFAAGNFLYIGATDLIPEVKHHQGGKSNVVHFGCFLLGLAGLLAVRLINKGW